MKTRRWEYCVYQRGSEIPTFVDDYFAAKDRRVLVIAGLGFDWRSINISATIASPLGERVQGLLLQEERPNPDPRLVERVSLCLHQMQSLIPVCDVQTIEIFAPDGAVVSGRNAVRVIRQTSLDSFTDIVIDASALSIGILFPLVRYVLHKAESSISPLHVHLMFTSVPAYDDAITATASDIVGTIHGFKGGLNLDQNYDAARLWLPQLVKGQRAVLDRLHTYVNPHDVCPILPFPAHHPRMADRLIEYYQQEFESTWEVDDSAIVYAAEHNPLDLYRTVLRIDETRKRIFEVMGNSLIVLSPIGSKTLALGAMMAAIERDLPVTYVETVAYMADWSALPQQPTSEGEIIHLWLYDGEHDHS
ncbi:hypothetical protein SE17_00735 [Kouleothrix aurantiaca]|uniref:Uncharacterized protein n=1 Tax=Kouleothrix aurantiaca TaxID=186479 RepID=A0A0P9DN93_9CHLR|nr:hypothetical protein SE17_00735 [Kouleothrix aurantiaca]